MPTRPENRPRQRATMTRVALPWRDPAPSQNPVLSPQHSPFLPFSHHHSSFSFHLAPASHQITIAISLKPVSAVLLSEELSATKSFPSGSRAIFDRILSRGPVDYCFFLHRNQSQDLFSSHPESLQSSRGTGLNWPSALILPGFLTEVLPFSFSSCYPFARCICIMFLRHIVFVRSRCR